MKAKEPGLFGLAAGPWRPSSACWLLLGACQAGVPSLTTFTTTSHGSSVATSASAEPEPATAVAPQGRAELPPPPPATRAPQPGGPTDPRLAALQQLCGPGDVALHRAAEKLLGPALMPLKLDTSSLTFAVRTSGAPYVGTRGLRLQFANARVANLEQQLAPWLSELGPSPTRRCGVAASFDPDDGVTRIGVIAAEALALLAPLPSRVAAGSRVRFSAQLLVPSTHVELVVLGPRGLPRRISAQLKGDRVDAAFYLDVVGTHLIQLMIDREGGPEPAVEAWIGAGASLPVRPLASRAPGEHAAVQTSSPEQRVTEMLNAARRSEGLLSLRRDSRLDRLARAHALAMQRSGRLAHDLGDGNPVFRIQAAGLTARAAGENLARAPTLERTHRAIWASPSHRANLLALHFDSVGIGVVRAPNGDWWVCELLVDQQ